MKSELINALKGEDVFAVIVEGIQGIGGLDAPTTEYLSFLADNCKKYGAMLILERFRVDLAGLENSLLINMQI